MYKIIFKYKNGSEGVCNEYGKDVVFENENEATEYANKLNDIVAPNVDNFFPVWNVVKC
jgi:hypothetical protein